MKRIAAACLLILAAACSSLPEPSAGSGATANAAEASPFPKNTDHGKF
jgi:hypothetical protein